MKKVKEEHPVLSKKETELLPKIHFSDTFSTTNHENNIQEITNLIFNTLPHWVKLLFKIRNSLAKIIGLKTGAPNSLNNDFKVGEYVKFFKIYSVSNSEIVLGANDSHLNFRAIVKNDNSEIFNIKVITLVEYNNNLGRVYMRVVKPFHRLVVMHLVKNAYK
jgi:hypothetical protein